MQTIILLLICLIIILIFNNTSSSKEFFENNKDPKYIINLDKRIDRWKITSKLLNNYGYTNLERFKAIEGNRIPKNELTRIVSHEAMEPVINGYRTEHHHLSIGAIGCYLSHINVWELGNETNHSEYIIIFEDDTYPTLTSKQLQEKLIDLPPDWDIALFGGIYYTDQKVNETWCKIDRFYCLHAYMINKKCINYLLKNTFPIKQQIDSWLSDLSHDSKINVYGLIQNDWMQNETINNTDIQTPMIQEPI